MANKVAYMDNLGGCHVEVLDEINSKFDWKDKLMVTLII
jgi:hypothetical protein